MDDSPVSAEGAIREIMQEVLGDRYDDKALAAFDEFIKETIGKDNPTERAEEWFKNYNRSE